MTSTQSCQQEGASSGTWGLLSSCSSVVAGSTTVMYLNRTRQKHSNHRRRDGGGPEPEAILHERTRAHTLPSASSARKGAQSSTCVRKAQEAARCGASRISSCRALTQSHRPCRTVACGCPSSITAACHTHKFSLILSVDFWVFSSPAAAPLTEAGGRWC